MRRVRTRAGRNTPSALKKDKGNIIVMQAILSITFLIFIMVAKAAGAMPAEVRMGMSAAIETHTSVEELNAELWKYISVNEFLRGVFNIIESTPENETEAVFDYASVMALFRHKYASDLEYAADGGWQSFKVDANFAASVFSSPIASLQNAENTDAKGGEAPPATAENGADYTVSAGGESTLSGENLVMSRLDLNIDFIVPTNGTVSSRFGARKNPIGTGEGFHHGVDIAAPLGQPIYSAADGVVADAGVSEIYGRYVKIDHGGGITTFYAHCQRIIVKKGGLVKAGQKIATVGNTGYSTGSHLHFEISKDGVFLNPEHYLKLV